MLVVGEAIVETTDIAPDLNGTQPGAQDAGVFDSHAAHEHLAELTKAVQTTLESTRDAFHGSVVVYGVCMCMPQVSEQTQPHREAHGLNVLLLTAHAGDHNPIKLTAVKGDESAEARRVLRTLLSAMHRALAVEPETGTLAMDGGADHLLHAGENGALPHHKLSEREFQVVHMLSKGKTVGAISKELNLSVKTVSTYRVRALKKMNFKTNAELIRYMIHHELG